MNENVSILIEKLAEKLGTTTQHLWGVLVKQAPISGVIDLVISCAMVFFAVYLLRFAMGRTTVPDVTEKNKYPKAKVDEPTAIILWMLTVIYLAVVSVCVVSSIRNGATAFLNPEYWALDLILKKI